MELVLYYKMIIKTISPVHIGTGKIINSLCYKKSDSLQVLTNVADLLEEVAPEQLLKPSFQDELSKAKTQNDVFKAFSKVIPEDKKKELRMNDIKFGSKINVHEQIKSNDQPYIPGSSIKGQIITAILYQMLYDQIMENKINEIKVKKILTDKSKKKNIIAEMLSVDDNFIKLMSSLIRCFDIYFNEFYIIEGKRFGGKKGHKIPSDHFEVIAENQKVNINSLFTVNKRKLKIIKDNNINNYSLEKIELLNKYINDEAISKALSFYTKQQFKYEKKYRDQHKNIPFIANSNFDLIEEKIKNSYVIRIGMGCTYNFKVISTLIKEHYPRLYEIYFKKFKPTEKCDPKIMPKTRVLFSKGVNYYFSGYIEVSDSE